ncbi:MAG: AMP-binding protein, partial [FCB group bacterium]|nr:AMP-binding protein [FCB group bacterium]
HSNVTRLFSATKEWFNFNEKDVWTLFHSYAFDFSVWEIWGALSHGGCLLVIPYYVSRSPEDFYRLLSNHGVTVLNQTPSAFLQLIRAEELVGISEDLKLRLVIFGGEALNFQSLKPWFDRHGGKTPNLINMYGITETTVHVTYYPITSANVEESGSIVGRPIPDLQSYILDSALNPVPPGVVGELYIGGPGLARGYLNRPRLTAERFVKNHFIQEPDSRLYMTGDLARYLPDGRIEYLGRIDNQVQIRGFRVELGEIETLLSRHEMVKENVVVVRENQDKNRHLAAYIVTEEKNDENAEENISELRSHLKAKLPDYMIPTFFIFMNTLPLTPNGKLDRKALPEPDMSAFGARSGFVAPGTPNEKLLAGIWGEVLEVEAIGVHDGFFELGGDSIQSIKVIAKAREAGLDFSVKQLFENQTIHELARVSESSRGFLPESEVKPFALLTDEDRIKAPDDLDDAYPLSALQAGMYFHTEYSKDTAVYHDIFSYHIQEHMDDGALEKALEHVVNRHPVLRTSFAVKDFSEPLQFVHKKVKIAIASEDLAHMSFDEQEAFIDAWIEKEKKRGFDWSRPPFVRFVIHHRGRDTFNLGISFHHAILDGWSVASMVTELFLEYRSLLTQKTTPPLPVLWGFRDFIALERDTAESEECKDYWLRKLEDINILKIPRWPERFRSDSIDRIETESVSVSSGLSAGLKKLSKQAGVPIKSILLAAHMKVLSTLGGVADITSGLVLNGRLERSESEQTLGLFLNT